MSLTVTASPRRGDADRPHDSGVLLEIQALRALAVLLVVVYHVWPGRLPGGFIGVDVFFVISGYLITAHLIREHEAKGRISLTQFWARRIRRLLPAAVVVLATCTALLLTVLPQVVREQSLRQVAAAAAYVLNWVLGFDAVDYLASGNSATIVQHFWTLSVEEQFYIGWPILLVATLGITAALRRDPRGRRTPLVVGWAAIAVVVVSLTYSMFLTWFSPAFAYFATTTRAWEFAAGAALSAVVVSRPDLVRRVRNRVGTNGVLSLVGVLLILVAAFALDGDSPFPGFLAVVPVLGTGLVILGGMPRPRPLAFVVGMRPVQFLGDVSYSLYLWHWPVITAFAMLAARRPNPLEGLAIVAGSVALAAATKAFVEDPARTGPILVRRRLPAYLLAAVSALLFTGVWLGSGWVDSTAIAHQREQRAQQIEDTVGCFGVNAMLGGGACPDRFVLGDDTDLVAAANDLDYQNWCLTWYDQAWASCEFGDTAATNGTYALIGDSHAASMVAAFDEYFADRGIRVVSYLRFGCSGLNLSGPGAGDESEKGIRERDCRTWSDRVRAELVARDDIDKAIYWNYTSSYVGERRDPPYQLEVDDIVATWSQVAASGKEVVVVKDWPRTAGQSVPECLATKLGELAPCAIDRATAMPPDPQDDAVDRMGGVVDSIDLTNAYCDAARCYGVIGGVVVYADHNHISGTYSRTLMTYLGPMLEGVR